MFTLGIAANTAVFSIFNGLFLSPMPFPDSHRLVYINESAPRFNRSDIALTYADFEAFRSGSGAFESIAAFKDGDGANLSGFGEPIRVKIAAVTHNMTAMLGVKPVFGRDFLPYEDHKSMGKVVQLTYGLWQRQFGGRADIVGKIISLDNLPFEIIGVLPKNAVYPGDVDLWMPLGPYFLNDQTRIYAGVGRLKPGVSVEQARADLLRIHKGLIPSKPVNQSTEPTVMPLRDHYVGSYWTVTQALLATVGFVLLIACVNVGGLMLARGKARSKELAIRQALGAGRRQLVLELLGETLLLAAAGSVVGLALGWTALRSTVALTSGALPSWVSFPLDLRVACFSIAVTAAAALLAGFAPAFQFSKIDLRGFLADASPKATRSAGQRRASDLLIITEIAVAFVLLAAGGLMVRAFHQILRTNPGFEPGGVLTFSLDPSYGWPPDVPRLTRFYDELLAGLRAIPGVDSAAAVGLYNLPLGGLPRDVVDYSRQLLVEGMPLPVPPQTPPSALQTSITPGYFRAMGIELPAGRDFDDRDGANDGSASIIVDETFARRFWPASTGVLGKRVRFWGPTQRWMTVVGVARDVRHDGLDRDLRASIYVPARQNIYSQMSIVIRGKIDPGALLPAAREIVRKIDPTLAVFDVHTMTELVDHSLWARRASSWLFGAFAGIALMLAVAGIYGVVSYAITQRTREIGIRMALGAKPSEVLGMVLREGMASVGIGVAIGLAGSFFAMRLLQSLLAGVSSYDSWTLTATAVVLGAAALAANWVPARRAALVDPMDALRRD